MSILYECVGGPWDGRMIALHEGNRLRIYFGPPPSGMARLTDEEISRPVERRSGTYQLFRPKKKHLTYLKWMGED